MAKADVMAAAAAAAPARSRVRVRVRMRMWMLRATASVLLWTGVVQLTALGETWGPRVLKGWPSCNHRDRSSLAAGAKEVVEVSSGDHPRRALPPKSESCCLLCR